MEFFKHHKVYDFMRLRRLNVMISLVTFLIAILVFAVPLKFGSFDLSPIWGIDFKGGTEIQVEFNGNVSPNELRAKLAELHFDGVEVVSVAGHANEYIIRVEQVTTMPRAQYQALHDHLARGVGPDGARVYAQELKLSPGGDKLSVRFSGDIEPDALRAVFEQERVRVRQVTRFGQTQDHRFEVQLVGTADKVIEGLHATLGDRAPERPLRVEWVGPKAGAQLRNAAIMSILYAVLFIMVFVAFRFDLRFAPGSVIAMLHDAVITAGILVLLRRELTLTTVAALLTIVGYSINDTIVVYDRIRENLQRMRGKSLIEIINVSTSQTLSRTILTSTVTATTMIAFLFLGTQVIKDFALAMLIGIAVGTYSSIYVAAPVTEWIDRKFFRRAAATSTARRGQATAKA